ncbi:MAG: AbrB/MazE/SpoVT family DNA-binding domain-containing protein [Actinomycetota bacterium]|nr:AbrB/MazE/SpoVT family DNA-binding domain-containing protein [Actinomycetota bacterium]
MRAKVRRCGNGVAVRIPTHLAEQVGLADDSDVELRLVCGGLLVMPASSRSVLLDTLLDGVTDENCHGESDTGASEGREAW